MPVPLPFDGESERDFTARCMDALQGTEHHPDTHVAICMDTYREHTRAHAPHRVKIHGATIEMKFIKSVSAPIEVTGDRTVRFILSTGAVDRDNDRVNPRGWNLEDYSGVVLWGHDHSRPPIARSRVWVERDRLIGEATFPPAGASPFADEVLALIKAGVITDCSVGFNPFRPPTPNEHGGFNFDGQSLLEWSIVSLGSNPDSKVLARALDESELTVLKGWCGASDPVRRRAEPAGPERGDPMYDTTCASCGAAMAGSFNYCPACGKRRTGQRPPVAATTGTERAWASYIEKVRQEEAAWAGVTSADLKAIVQEAGATWAAEIKREIRLEMTGELD